MPPAASDAGEPGTGIRVLISASDISGRVREIGEEICLDYPDPSRSLLMLGVLRGGAIFLADLARAVTRSVELDFVQFASYHNSTQTTGSVEIVKDVTSDVYGKDVLVVEDILDTGETLTRSGLLGKLEQMGAASVRVCVLLDKPSRRRHEVAVHYRGFTIEDLFVVGYGLDLAQKYRNLPFIGVLNSA